MNLSSEPQSLHYCQGYIFRGAGERNRGYALLMTAKKPEAALYRAPTFSLLLASHGGINALKYSGTSLIRSPSGPNKLAGLKKWPHFREPR